MITLWKCDPSNIQNCLNCQYPDCKRIGKLYDPVSDELDKEIKSDIARANTNNLNQLRYERSEKGKARAKRYNSSEKGKMRTKRANQKKIDSGKNAEMCRQYYERREELNKGITYGFVYDYYLLHRRTPSIVEISEKLFLSENKVRLYLRQLTEERLIDYREEITIY